MRFIPLVSVGLLFGAVSSMQAEYAAAPSDFDDVFLQKIMAQLSLAAMEEVREEAEAAAEEEEEQRAIVEEDTDRMSRDRKEGQMSVYNYAPSIRDQEYLEHSSLWGHQYVAGGAGEGIQRLKPDGSAKNIQVVKSDAVLPAYCNPPNPCPIGYSGEDGCLEEFDNTAAFSRQYQQNQDCMCDTEHMFDCPTSTKEDEVNTLARQITNEGIMDSTLDRIQQHLDKAIPVEGQHKSLVAKKFFNKSTQEYTKRLSEKNRMNGNRVRREVEAHSRPVNKTVKPIKKHVEVRFNPYLQGEKLPVVAKKG